MSIPFHRLARTTRINPAKPARWWHSLAEVLVFILAGLVLANLWYRASLALADSFGVPRATLSSSEATHPLGLVDLTMYIIIMMPAALIAARLGGRRIAGFTWSVAGRIRWSLLWRSVPPVLAVYLVYCAVAIFTGDNGAVHIDRGALVMLVVIFALIPLQAAAEEVVFRGWLPQLLGTWIRNPLVPYLVSLPIFMAGHEYGLKGQIDIAIFATCAAALTHYTRGLEAAIILHTAGNLTAFGLETIGVYESATSDAGFAWSSVVGSAIATVAATLLLLRHSTPRLESPGTGPRPGAAQPGAPRESEGTDALAR